MLDCKSIQSLNKFYNLTVTSILLGLFGHRILLGMARGNELKIPPYLTPKPEVVETRNLACCSSTFFGKTGVKKMTLT